MIVLGLDASGDGVGAAVVDGQGVRGACWAGRGARPAAALVSLADRALQAGGLDRSALQGVAVGLGPGSYAGVRAACATANALAWSAGLPLAAVGSLRALAFAAGRWTDDVWVATDARRGRVYAALYRWGPDGVLEVRAPGLLSKETLLALLSGPALLAGSGVAEHDVATAPAACIAPASVRAGVPAAVAVLGRARLLRGECDDPFALVPTYVSDPDIGPVRLSPMRPDA